MRRLVIAALAILILSAAAWADGGFINSPYNKKPEKEHTFVNTSEWDLESVLEGVDVKARLKLTCYDDDRDELRIDFSGLQPNSVYTVWLVTSMKDTAMRAGLGDAPHSFKTAGGGGKLFQVPMKICPLVEYKWLEVRLHPDGDPTHMDSSVRVAKVRLLAQ